MLYLLVVICVVICIIQYVFVALGMVTLDSDIIPCNLLFKTKKQFLLSIVPVAPVVYLLIKTIMKNYKKLK